MAELHVIKLEDLRALVRVGVPDPERARPQEVMVSVALALDAGADFLAHDRLSNTLDYDRIIGFVREDLGAPAHLIETLAERVAQHCLGLSPQALWVEVVVKKPSVLRDGGLVSVMLRRERP